MDLASALLCSDRVPPASTGLAQAPGKSCLMVEDSSGSSWEGPKKERIREGLCRKEVFPIDSESKLFLTFYGLSSIDTVVNQTAVVSVPTKLSQVGEQ